MFIRIEENPAEALVTFLFEGRPITARAGDSVAAALLLAGVATTRTSPVSGAPRAAYCMMGSCFECLMVIDGAADRQACLTPVADGMVVSRQLPLSGGGS